MIILIIFLITVFVGFLLMATQKPKYGIAFFFVSIAAVITFLIVLKLSGGSINQFLKQLMNLLSI